LGIRGTNGCFMLIDEDLIKKKFAQLITKESDNIIFKSRKNDRTCIGCEKVCSINLTYGEYIDECNYAVNGKGEFKYVIESLPCLEMNIPNITFEAYIKVEGDSIVKIANNTIYLKD